MARFVHMIASPKLCLDSDTFPGALFCFSPASSCTFLATGGILLWPSATSKIVDCLRQATSLFGVSSTATTSSSFSIRLHHCITDKGTVDCEQSVSIQLLTLMHKEDPLVWGPSLLNFPFPSPPLFSGPKHQCIAEKPGEAECRMVESHTIEVSCLCFWTPPLDSSKRRV
jgi:hypothetical protein